MGLAVMDTADGGLINLDLVTVGLGSLTDVDLAAMYLVAVNFAVYPWISSLWILWIFTP